MRSNAARLLQAAERIIVEDAVSGVATAMRAAHAGGLAALDETAAEAAEAAAAAAVNALVAGKGSIGSVQEWSDARNDADALYARVYGSEFERVRASGMEKLEERVDAVGRDAVNSAMVNEGTEAAITAAQSKIIVETLNSLAETLPPATVERRGASPMFRFKLQDTIDAATQVLGVAIDVAASTPEDVTQK